MTPRESYKISVAKRKTENKKLKGRKDRFTIFRLATVVTGAIVIYQLGHLSPLWGWLSFFAFTGFFLWLVKKDSQNDRAIREKEELIRLSENELKPFSERTLFDEGERFQNPEHQYSYDLDLFGSFSLYKYLNRTVTEAGNRILAGWLKNPSNKTVIEERQQAAKELSGKITFREQFLRTVFLEDKKEQEIGLLQWIKEFKPVLKPGKKLKVLIFLLPSLTIISLILSFFISFFWTVFILLLFVNYAVLSRHADKVQLIHNHIDKRNREFLKYSKLIKLVSGESFESALTASLQNKLLKAYNAEGELKKISLMSKQMDNRHNLLISLPLNLFTFWEIHLALKVEDWFAKNGDRVRYWIEIIGEFDALLSVSVLHFNHPEWCFPEISTEFFQLEAESAGHPLIPEEERVNNDYSLSGETNIDIITGSNMAGKSTFLRTLGVNTALALAGCPVCAGSMKVSTARLMTYMRTQDNMEEHTSSFYAELKRIRNILENVEKHNNCFLLLDEILKGTNSKDRHTGSVALLKQLLKHKVAGLIATHDLHLAELEKELPENIRNFHFDVSVKHEELYFDYRLKEGICISFNASLLMRKIGIDIDSPSQKEGLDHR